MKEHIFFKDGALFVLDQRLLPFREEYVSIRGLDEAERAIKEMVVRGAPLIGIVCGYGFALEAKRRWERKGGLDEADIEEISSRLRNTRPTGANLFWAIRRMEDVYRRCRREGNVAERLLQEAISIHGEDVETNRRLSLNGSELIEDGDTVLTHCNAGALATGGYGTALGVIRAARDGGKNVKVFATETRPYLQGARLTVYELLEEGIEVTLVPDNHVGVLCAKGRVKKVLVGADRIALNGDFANKVGTYMIALCAKRHGIPLFVAAPLSTFDREARDGSDMVLEEREGREVLYLDSKPITLDHTKALYFSFDVTPSSLVTCFITERGIIGRPFKRHISRLLL